MKRTIIILGVILILLMSSPSFNCNGTEGVTSSIIYVDADGTSDYTRIQDAIDYSSEGDTIYVFNGTYKENIIVDKSITLTGEDKNSTIIDGSGHRNVIDIVSNTVTINGFTIQNSSLDGVGFGIHLYRADHCIIYDNYVENNFEGMQIGYSNDNMIFQNNISYNHNKA